MVIKQWQKTCNIQLPYLIYVQISCKNMYKIVLTIPELALMQFILILEMNFTTGASSGYFCPHSTLTEYILFSYGVRGGPIIMPIQWVRVMSSSFSRPQLMVPSPTPFCPASSSSSRRKFRGTTANNNTLLLITRTSKVKLSM